MINTVAKEYSRACLEHPEFASGSIDKAVVILAEEFGEVAKAVDQQDYEALKKELAQVVAVGFRFLEMLEERNAEVKKP